MTLKHSRFTTVIFDLDGTLIDSYPGICDSLNFALKSLQLTQLDLDTVKKRVGQGLENLIRQSVKEDLVEEGIRLFRSSYEQNLVSGTTLLPGVQETLALLCERGIKMAVASNKPADYSKRILQNLGIVDYFEECLGPDDAVRPKPHPSMLHKLMQRMRVQPQHTLYVGDMLMDAETAKNSNVAFALVATGAYSLEDLRGAHPDYLLQDIRQLPEIFHSRHFD